MVRSGNVVTYATIGSSAILLCGTVLFVLFGSAWWGRTRPPYRSAPVSIRPWAQQQRELDAVRRNRLDTSAADTTGM